MTTHQQFPLGANIRRRREELGLSQRELSERSGLQRTWIGNLEIGAMNNPTIQKLAQLAAALETTVPTLLGAQEEPVATLRTSLANAKAGAEQLIATITVLETQITDNLIQAPAEDDVT